MRVASSARSGPSSGVNMPISAASGASISRDQCDSSGAGAPMRGSVVSNHGAPPISSRTVTRRTASSVSPSQSESDGPGPASVAITRNAVASSARPSGVTNHRPSAGRLGNPLRKATTVIAAAPGFPVIPHAPCAAGWRAIGRARH